MDLLAEGSYQLSADVSLETLSQRCPVCDISSFISVNSLHGVVERCSMCVCHE